jgi:hypothetical protein
LGGSDAEGPDQGQGRSVQAGDPRAGKNSKDGAHVAGHQFDLACNCNRGDDHCKYAVRGSCAR